MSNEKKNTLYFAYGSNLWIDQMARRCPGNTLLGLGIMRDWKWIIGSSGYANVIESPGDLVHGFVYTLTPDDEEKLDGFESSGELYNKQMHDIEHMGRQEECLVYVDVERPEQGHPRFEYIDRMNKAIRDALKTGVPKEYIQRYLRPFIPKQ